MTPRDRGKRQRVIDESVVDDLTGGRGGRSNVVADLVEQQMRGEQEAERENPVRPAERRRRDRKLTVTFSVGNEDVPDRLRELAVQWGSYGPDGKSPGTSAVVEYLLLPQLEAAERGEIPPPPLDQQADSWT